MKIEKVKIKKFKVLSDIESDLSGHHVILTGDNEVGKSSFIQFLDIALGNSKNIPPNANGAGEVLVNKDGKKYTFKVKLEQGKPVVTVISEDGMVDSRKGTIATIVGAIDFDIDEFVELSKSKAGQKKQVEIFKSFLPPDVQMELGNFENKIRISFEERTELGREIKKLEGAISQNPLNLYLNSELQSFTFTDTVEVMAKLKEATAKNELILKGEKFLVDADSFIEERKIKIGKLQAEINAIQDEVAKKNIDKLKTITYLSTHAKIDITPMEAAFLGASDNNGKYSNAQNLLKERAKIELMRSEYGELTALIESSKQTISDTVKQMDSPIDGLTYDDELLVYNSVPVNPDCLSTSQIMELGLRLKIAENKDRPLFLPRAESIGSARWKTIIDFANANNMQIIAEKVVSGQEKLIVEILT